MFHECNDDYVSRPSKIISSKVFFKVYAGVKASLDEVLSWIKFHSNFILVQKVFTKGNEWSNDTSFLDVIAIDLSHSFSRSFQHGISMIGGSGSRSSWLPKLTVGALASLHLLFGSITRNRHTRIHQR